MKKTIIVLIILTICSLILFILINKDQTTSEFKYNNTYTKITTNHINDELYSTRKETITILDGLMNYESTITYENKNTKPITIEYINTYKEKENRLITKNKTYYITDTSLCLESIDCNSPYLVDTFNVENKIETLNTYETIKKINPTKEGVELYVIVNKNMLTKKDKTILKNITNDFNIQVKIIEITNKNKKELTEKYNITSSKTYALYLNGELSSIDTNLNTHKEIALYLFLKGIDYR